MTQSTTRGALLRPIPSVLLLLLLSACGGAMQTIPNGPNTPEVATEAPGEPGVTPGAKDPDHDEFEASLDVPFASAEASGARKFTVNMSYPGSTAAQTFVWQLELRDPENKVVQAWSGETPHSNTESSVVVTWPGRVGHQAALPDGSYSVHLKAAVAQQAHAATLSNVPSQRVQQVIERAEGHGRVEQSWDFLVGKPAKPAMPSFTALRVGSDLDANGHPRAMAAPATGSLPYTVYYTNLHSQTNDSDGGGAVGSCSSSQPAQSGEFGPAAAFSYGKSAGLDALMTSEHNHYFDGSSSTNASGNASTAKSRFQSGLSAASNASTSNFLAIYGMEWGVINNGGHLNIFNSNELFSWEYNNSNQLFGDRYVAKSDYAALYSVMRQQGLIGQFNHPDSSGQFAVNGTDLGYSADGDEVMVLAEILNTSAFSSNTNETEAGRSNYEGAYKKMLERGFHVAPASNQDNHCANWGKSYTNRTAVLIPSGTAWNKSSFLAALKARRTFATMDKNSQLVLTANGHVMGERFSNSGSLALKANYANSSGHSAATVQIFEGVPGRNGTVSTLASSASTTITPSTGNHFYYAKVTQDDGKILWSAPVWVNQGSGNGGGGDNGGDDGSDTTSPTATVSESGNGGTIILSATASDNVGVSRVDFLIDSVVKGSDSSAPYSLAFDSTTLTNGTHSLVARAYDAAGNSGASSAVSFSISNAGAGFTETESNGTVATANSVSASQTTTTGTIGSASDKDFFKLILPANKALRIDMVGPAANDYDLFLVNASGTTLKSSESNTSDESLIYQNGSSAQTVYIKVISYSGSSTTQPYTLSLSYP